MGPKVTNVKRHAGVAGQYEVSATVEYEGEEPQRVTFSGSAYGGPIVMVTPSSQVFVSQDVIARLGGGLSESWVRRFFGEGELG